MNKLGPRIAAIALVFAVLIGLAELGVRLVVRTNPETGVELLGRVALLPYVPDAERARATIDEAEESTYVGPDDALGWSLVPGGASGENYTANPQGVRAAPDRVYTATVPPGKVRVSLFGDSFTHGDGLPLTATWAHQLEQSDDALEVMNFGIPGFGADQAYLRYRRDGKAFEHSVVILAIWPEDIVRNLNVFRFYMTPQASLSSSKPRFVRRGGELAVVNQPVLGPKATVEALVSGGRHPLFEYEFWVDEGDLDFPAYYHLKLLRGALSVLEAYQRREVRHAQYFEESSEANQLQLEMAKAFAAEVKATGALPVVAIVPMIDFIEQHGNDGFPLVGMLERAGIEVLDFGPRFAKLAAEAGGARHLYLPDNHLNRAGNAELAAQTRAFLAARFDAIAAE